jgi:NADH-quinone oxidoreductase subunit A
VVGIGFIFAHLMAGKLIRPNRPDAEKGTIYECGEPTIGSAWIQFDLRFYVVALLFVIFDVEVAFFFPWAEIFGKANAVARAAEPTTVAEFNDYGRKMLSLVPANNDTKNQDNRARYTQMVELTEEKKAQQDQKGKPLIHHDIYVNNQQNASTLAWLAFWEILVFFGILLVGFAYLWKRGDLEWVRSLVAERQAAVTPTASTRPESKALVEAGHHS